MGKCHQADPWREEVRELSGERAQLVQRPVGWVLADVLCVLAECGHKVRRVQQGSDGCALECVIAPASHALIGGHLVVTVERTSQGTGLREVAHLPGRASSMRELAGGYSIRFSIASCAITG